MSPTAALALLDEPFMAIGRDEKTIDALSAITMAKGKFAECTMGQRREAFHLLNRLYEGGNKYAEATLNRLINLQ